MEETKNVVTNENFDWNAYENDLGVYDHPKEEIAEAYDKTLSNVNVGEVVEGTVTGITKREVLVNIGYKSEGVIPVSEFRYNPDLKVGDKIEVYVESAEDKGGQLVLSHKKARQLKSWDRVNEALEKDEIIKGYIKCRTKGGMIVDVFGIEAFLPGSQIDVKPIRDYDVYVDKTMEFKVVKINQEFRNVVVSHKALIEAELEAQKQVIMSKLEKGQILEGTVKNITSYGVFVDLGGVDGLIHITDLSWGRVNHPEEIVALDQKIQVVILDFDDAKKRIALGLKQLTPHPWEALDQNLKVGDKVKGRVVVMADYGAFVEIAPGVEGLIHVSEMSWSQHLRSAQEFMKVGDEVEAVILTLDREERKMSLGIKQLTPDPWENIETKYPVGTKCTAKVRNFTNFGIFVEIEEGIDGLIHISDLSWTKKVKHPGEFTSVGADIEVVVLEIDKETGLLQQTRPAFGGNLMAAIVCPNHRPQMATVRPGVFPMGQGEARQGTVVRLPVPALSGRVQVESAQPAPQSKTIADAQIIVAVGRGIGSQKNMQYAYELARLLGGQVGASRPLVDAGWAQYPMQVGQTGKTVAPKLYIACGISGAIQHLAGIGGAETIVAINTDPDAPIFGAAQYKVVGDAVEVVEELLAQLER